MNTENAQVSFSPFQGSRNKAIPSYFFSVIVFPSSGICIRLIAKIFLKSYLLPKTSVSEREIFFFDFQRSKILNDSIPRFQLRTRLNEQSQILNIYLALPIVNETCLQARLACCKA